MEVVAPTEPLTVEAVIERWPELRQSLLGEFDNCSLSAYLSMKYANGWSTRPQAGGILFHRAAAEILRTMQANNTRTIPRREAVQILIEVTRQVDTPPEDIVRVPLRELWSLRSAVDKLAKDNEFSTSKIVDIERRLYTTLRYEGVDGVMRDRTITGKLDVLLFEPPDGAVVLDWKSSWALPPEPKDPGGQGYDDDELKGLSFMGYFQQRVYGLLVMRNYRNVDRVTLREYYPRKTKVRRATLHRHQLPDVEQELGLICAHLDAALAQGAPNLRADADGRVNMAELGWWRPQPGEHCGFCTRPSACPIPDEVRVAAGGAVTNPEQAERWVARLQIAERIKKAAIDGLKGYVETSGQPVPAKWSKGRLFVGWHRSGRGRKFGLYTPDQSDRGGHADLDDQLREAMRQATARARAERGAQPRRRGARRKAA